MSGSSGKLGLGPRPNLRLLDKAAQRLSYALLTDTSFGNCPTTMAVRDRGPSQAELLWTTSFQSAGIPASEGAELMEGALA